ncbi:MAG: hypothetical protein ACREE5_09535 [Acetobacteraceae bacterium]
MYHRFTRAETEAVLRNSEGAATSHRGTGAPAHAGSRHLLLTNDDLLRRYTQKSEQEVWQNNRHRRAEYTLVTAFCTLADMIDAAQLVLNAGQTQAALSDFFVNTPSGPGMRAKIAFTSSATFRMRYAQGAEAVRTMPVNDLIMVLDRIEGRPFNVQVQTFYGTLDDAARNEATIYTANGARYRSHCGPG